ncbi:MAG TPA: hypothetical protein VH165_06180 [Kofleriaceae bacterium]|jgi:hypothetical protein|nr:hypothetical protein [Kofleriaceae bacterium]
MEADHLRPGAKPHHQLLGADHRAEREPLAPRSNRGLRHVQGRLPGDIPSTEAREPALVIVELIQPAFDRFEQPGDLLVRGDAIRRGDVIRARLVPTSGYARISEGGW